MRHTAPLALTGSLLVLLVLPLAAVADDGPVAEPKAPAWSELAFLESHLTKACDAIEKETGWTYPERPKVQITDEEGMTKVLVAEMAPIFKNLGTTSDTVIEATARQLASALTAKYEPSTNIIHMMPDNIVRLSELLKIPAAAEPGPIRILLLHEATHAIDFQRFPRLNSERLTRKNVTGIQAVGAVVEGHAQMVAERVAMTWEMHNDWKTLTALILADAPVDDPGLKVALDAQMAETRFAYREGLRFMRAIEEGGGPEAVERALANPPDDTRDIERPELWLDPSKAGPQFDAEPALAVMAKLIEGEPTRMRLKRALLEGGFSVVPAEEREPVLEKFEDGWVLTGSAGGEGSITAAVVVLQDEATAAAYVRMSEKLLKAKDAEVAKSVVLKLEEAEYGTFGPEDTGIFAAKRISYTGGEQRVMVFVHSRGRVALEFNAIQPSMTRDELEAVVLETLDSFEAGSRTTPSGAGQTPIDGLSLEEVARAFHGAREREDGKALRALGVAVAPTRDELASVLRTGDATTAFLADYKGPVDVTSASDLALELGQNILAPKGDAQTELRIWAATTEEIAAYEKGTVAWAEFPGGMQRFAKTLAAPGRTWYVAEWTKPGEDAGVKYSCFTKVGQRFVFVFKPWRFMPR